MAKKQKEDAVIKNLKGFVRLGAETNSPGNISTGYFDLDFAIHHGCLPGGSDLSEVKNYDSKKIYGMPRGKIVEIFGEEGGGKSSLAYRVCGFAQKMGYSCAWIDTEHSFSDDLAQINGMDRTEVYYSDMSNENDEDVVFHAEDVFDAIVALCKSGVKVIVLDSVANLVPKARMEKDAEKQTVGIIAKLMSENLGKIANYASKHGVLIVFINQLREKIGVMWGCLHADTLINFADGSSHTIKKVVDNKMTGPIWCYNEEKDCFEKRQIIDWHYNGDVENRSDFISIQAACPENGSGRIGFTVTLDHEVLTEDGYKKASDIKCGDRLIIKQRSILNGSLGNFLSGVLCGDSHISNVQSRQSASLQIQDNIDKDYMDWKYKKLNSYLGFKKRKYQGLTKYMSDQFSELKTFQRNYPNRNPMYLLNNFSWMGFAVWIMDDASYSRGRYILSIKRFKGNFDILDQINDKLDQLGLYCRVSQGGRIVFDKDVSDKIAKEISPFVPSCMRHKLPLTGVSEYKDFDLEKDQYFSTTYAEVCEVDCAKEYKMKQKGKYDISVDRHHNYSVGGSNNGIIVHNSPETTPGGRSLKHNSSLRIQISKKGGKDADIYVEDEDGQKKLIGRKSRFNIRKNRFAKPFFDGIEVPIYYEPYFPDIEDIMFATGRQLQIIKVRKGEFSWGNLSKIEGKRGFIDMIKKKSLQSELYRDILKAADDNGVFLPPELSQWAEDNYEEPTVVEDNSEADNASEANEKCSTRGRKKKDSTSSSSDD